MKTCGYHSIQVSIFRKKNKKKKTYHNNTVFVINIKNFYNLVEMQNIWHEKGILKVIWFAYDYYVSRKQTLHLLSTEALEGHLKPLIL